MTGKVIAAAAVSLDGFVADLHDEVGPLFDWYENGEIELYGTDPSRPFHVSPASAEYVRPIWNNIGAVVIGRHLFDLTYGWGGVPAVGDHVVVVSHREEPAEWRKRFPDAPFTFVPGLAAAITRAKELAGDRDVSMTAGNLTGQALAQGLVDEVSWSVVPVVFGSGVRFFGDYPGAQVLLDDPQVVRGDRVTHLHLRVGRSPHP
jgi:dihydrofolate reductase